MTATTTEQPTAGRVRPRLKDRYRTEIAPALREEFGYANVMQIPTLTKIAVNMGVGDAARHVRHCGLRHDDAFFAAVDRG